MSVVSYIVEEITEKSDEVIKSYLNDEILSLDHNNKDVLYSYSEHWNMCIDEPGFYERCEILQRENNIDKLL
jgi:hypothetical protein